jgi:hypothetical protein
LFFATAADGLENRAVLQLRKEVVDTLVTIGVGTAHEAVANEADVQRF